MAMDLIELTQDMIDDEKDTFCDPLRGCVPGDFAIWSSDLDGMEFFEPFLIGLDCLLAWQANKQPSVKAALRLIEIAQDSRIVKYE